MSTKDTVIAEGAKKLAADGAHISTKRLRRQRRINRVVLVAARFAAPCLVVTGLWFDWRFLVLAVALWWVSYSRSMLVAIAEIELQRRSEEFVEHEMVWLKGYLRECRELISDAIDGELVTYEEWLDEANVAMNRQYGSDAPWSPTIWEKP